MPPRTRHRLAAKEKRELAARMKLDGHSLEEIARATGYASTGSASQAITEYLRQSPPQDIEIKREIERRRLDQMRNELLSLRSVLLSILAKTHVIVQHGKVVGRFSGWATDPESGQVLRDAETGKPIATFDEIEDDDPSIRVLAELRQNIAEQRKVSESLRRLDGLDQPVRIKIEDDEGLDDEIESLMAELNQQLAGPPVGHEG
jgi:hypothetical protein